MYIVFKFTHDEKKNLNDTLSRSMREVGAKMAF